MKQIIAALICGVIFGLGLGISQMVNPAKVLNFLDFAGTWDPSLAFVMGGAVTVYFVGFRLVTRQRHPLFARGFTLPTRNDLDAPLLGGAALFGLGWGLAGFCPGPALTGLAFGLNEVFIFVGAMLAGALVWGLIVSRG